MNKKVRIFGKDVNMYDTMRALRAHGVVKQGDNISVKK